MSSSSRALLPLSIAFGMSLVYLLASNTLLTVVYMTSSGICAHSAAVKCDVAKLVALISFFVTFYMLFMSDVIMMLIFSTSTILITFHKNKWTFLEPRLCEPSGATT